MIEERGSGWLTFASIVLIFGGALRLIDSLWAFRYKGALPENLDGGVLGSKLKTYAVVYLIVGVLMVLAGIYVLYRNQFFRWVGIVAAFVGGLSGVVWLPFYPVWGLIYIGIALLVAYALTMYGGREEPIR